MAGAVLEMVEGEAGLAFVLPGILLENDSDMEPEDSLDNDGYSFHADIKSEYHLQLEQPRIKTEIPDSCSDFFTLVTSGLDELEATELYR